MLSVVNPIPGRISPREGQLQCTQQLVRPAHRHHEDIANLPGKVAAVQTDLNAAKMRGPDRTLADIEAQTALNIENKNAEERKGALVAALKG